MLGDGTAPVCIEATEEQLGGKSGGDIKGTTVAEPK